MIHVCNLDHKIKIAVRAAFLAGILLPAFASLPGYQAMAQGSMAQGSKAQGSKAQGSSSQPEISGRHTPPPPPQAAPAATDISGEFRQVLEKHGAFSKHERYGEVWQPAAVAQDWQPYPACLWTYKADTGWYLDDPSEWGQIVHHHGRWTQDSEKGWLWIAGTEFSPAWVVWDNSPSKVGWAPKMPDIDEKDVSLEEYKKSGAFQYVDAAKFGQKCGGRAPRIAAAPPPPRFTPIRTAEPMPADGGVITGGGIVGVGIVVIGGICKFKPWLQMCKPVWGNFCKRHPSHPRCRIGSLPPSCSTGIRPSWCAPVCKTKPWMPMCKAGWGKKPKLVKKIFPHKFKSGNFRPRQPIVKRFGPHIRPHRIVRPHSPHFRPRQTFRPARSVGHRPMMRRHMSGNFRGRRF